MRLNGRHTRDEEGSPGPGLRGPAPERGTTDVTLPPLDTLEGDERGLLSLVTILSSNQVPVVRPETSPWIVEEPLLLRVPVVLTPRDRGLRLER